ncbi:MAG: DUF2779 domain-containing protein [Spirochaetota bacterium]
MHLRLSGADLPARSESDLLYPVTTERSRLRELGRALFPLGRDADTADPEQSDARPLFGARCFVAPFEATADVWKPQRPEGWAAVLVREGASIKESYLREAAFLDYCFEGCGARPEKIFIHHVNKAYERAGELDPQQLLVERDVTRRARNLRVVVESELEGLARELAEDPRLERYRDVACSRPQTCPVCSADLPMADAHHVSTLHRGGPLVEQLIADGITSIQEIPIERLSHPRQEIQQRVVSERRAHVDREALAQFLGRLREPVFYLDFEATSSAIPPFDRVRPWEHVPYLYSLHREEPEAEPAHMTFIMEPGTDARYEMVERLVADAGGDGSVVVYSAGFERGILRRLAETVPERQRELHELGERIVDLLDPFNEFSFYHHDQKGKVSLKAVLPVLADRDYSGERVQDGYTANLVYRYLSEQHVTGEERKRLMSDLMSYCAMDTMAMVHIVRELRRLAHE